MPFLRDAETAARPRNRAAEMVDGKLRRVRSAAEVEKRNARRKAVYYAGIDGEGVSDGQGRHFYVTLQWSDKSREHRASLVRPEGISTKEALDFLLWGIPVEARVFGYAFNYDLTMMLRDLPDHTLYRLFRPELRARLPGDPRGPKAVVWGDYRLNLVGTKFSLAKGKRRRVIWDIFRFYQKRFTTSLEDWKVASPEVVKRIEAMKEKRDVFNTDMLPAMIDYCFDECAYLADLVEKLVVAHDEAGLELKKFYGAGSTASALLTKLGVKDMKRDAGDKAKEMARPLACGFFGGRFENSFLGTVETTHYNYDICSAYPYQLRFLPCLEHGAWSFTRSRKRLDTARAALVNYTLEPSSDRERRRAREQAWGPFPFREETGAVVFPYESGGGWVWKDEYLAGESLFSHVGFAGAWVYDCDCDCAPFRDIPGIYLQRLKLGKDGPGIVLKLGPNSVYGKLAQSVGTPQFQSWIWAGMVTSGARAQLLQMLALHEDWSDVIAFATDSVVTRCQLTPPEPRDTGTDVLLDGKPNKPEKRLGAWDCKVQTRPFFFARPGIYYPLGAKEEDLEHIRARGIGRKNLVTAGPKLVEALARGQLEEIDLGHIRRFCGAKTSTHAPRKGEHVASRAETYGQWVLRPVVASLVPMPKREPKPRGDGSLRLRSMAGRESSPYRRALTEEALMLKRLQQENLEQPEGMYPGTYVEDDEDS